MHLFCSYVCNKEPSYLISILEVCSSADLFTHSASVDDKCDADIFWILMVILAAAVPLFGMFPLHCSDKPETCCPCVPEHIKNDPAKQCNLPLQM